MELIVVKKHIEDGAHRFLTGLKKEAANSRQASLVIRKYMVTGAITPDEEHLLKVQVADSLKLVGIIVPFVLIPGASILMPILISAAKKHNINLMPSSFSQV